MMLPRLSVVIPAYNEEDGIASCIESVLSTSYPNMEILVVDDRSTDRTAEIALRYSVQVIKRPTRGERSIARNDGLKSAKGEIVVFIDADCTVKDDALAILVSDFADEKIAGVGGIVETNEKGIVAQYRTYASREDWSEAQTPVETVYLPGGICAYRTNVLRDVGGFNARLGRHETFELGLRLAEHGYRLIGDPKAIVWHGHENSLKIWLRSAYGTGYDALSLLRLKQRTRAVRMAQLRQAVFLGFVVVLMGALLKIVPIGVTIYVVLLAIILETGRAVYSASEVSLHYMSAKYLLMVPVELVLRALIYAGYTVALLTAVSRALFSRSSARNPNRQNS